MAKHYKEKVKKKKNNRILNLMLIFFILLFLISSIKIVRWYLNNKDNEKVLEEISQAITTKKVEGEEKEFTVNFNMLKKKNDDTIAFLKVNGTNIEIPVVKTKDNDYYLTHNFNNEYNSAGWIFADYKNKFDGTDKNIVIYGHNMRDNSMFGSLKNVLKEEWYRNKDNARILLITEKEYCVYEVFSVYQIEKENYCIQTSFENDEAFTKFVKTIKDRSVNNFNVEVTKKDSILTLSTCANNNKYRVVLHAKKVNDKK